MLVNLSINYKIILTFIYMNAQKQAGPVPDNSNIEDGKKTVILEES